MLVDIWGKKMTPKEMARDMVQSTIQDAYEDAQEKILSRCKAKTYPTEREMNLIIDQYEKYLVRAANACGYDKWTAEVSATCEKFGNE